jgi:hypothetical protein
MGFWYRGYDRFVGMPCMVENEERKTVWQTKEIVKRFGNGCAADTSVFHISVFGVKGMEIVC